MKFTELMELNSDLNLSVALKSEIQILEMLLKSIAAITA